VGVFFFNYLFWKTLLFKNAINSHFSFIFTFEGLKRAVFRGWAVFFDPLSRVGVFRGWAELEGGRFLEEIRYLESILQQKMRRK
jgi:hypothetical protein